MEGMTWQIVQNKKTVLRAKVHTEQEIEVLCPHAGRNLVFDILTQIVKDKGHFWTLKTGMESTKSTQNGKDGSGRQWEKGNWCPFDRTSIEDLSLIFWRNTYNIGELAAICCWKARKPEAGWKLQITKA